MSISVCSLCSQSQYHRQESQQIISVEAVPEVNHFARKLLAFPRSAVQHAQVDTGIHRGRQRHWFSSDLRELELPQENYLRLISNYDEIITDYENKQILATLNILPTLVVLTTLSTTNLNY